MKNKHVYILSFILIVIGISLFAYKTLVLKFPVVADSTVKIWIIESEMSFVANKEPVKLSLYIPQNQQNYTIMKENFITRNYGRKTSKVNGKRRSVWTLRNPDGEQLLYYRVIVSQQADTDYSEATKKTPKIPAIEWDSAIQKAAANAIVESIKEKSADADSMISELLKQIKKPGEYENVAIFFGPNISEFSKIQLAVKILNYANVPARMVHGLDLSRESNNTKFLIWLDAFIDNKWTPYSLETGDSEIPEHYFIWSYGSHPVMKLTGASNPEMTVSISKKTIGALDAATSNGKKTLHPLLEFSIFSLPLHTQGVYQIMLLVPIGVLILVILRNIIGIKSFGTFMPVLIALAFRETHLINGIILFSLLITLGLSLRFYLAKLRLLLVPRLAALLTIVVLLMLVISIISHRLGVISGLSIALFPMVIITMTIERMSIVWDECGAYEGVMQGLGSLSMALLAYPIFTNDILEHIIFVFPELLLPVLAATLLIGRYSGYRLMELLRFNEFKAEVTDV